MTEVDHGAYSRQQARVLNNHVVGMWMWNIWKDLIVPPSNEPHN